jgi:hypothetical protein
VLRDSSGNKERSGIVMQTDSASRFYVGIDPSVSNTAIVVLRDSGDAPYLSFCLQHSSKKNGKETVGGSFGVEWLPELSEVKKPLVFTLPSTIPQYVYSGVKDTLDVNQIRVMSSFYFAVFSALFFKLKAEADIITVGIEAPMTVMHQGRGNLVERAFIFSCLYSSQEVTNTFTVNPSTHKKFTCGTGAAKKELVLKFVYKRWNFDTNSNDVADAYSIAQCARSQMLPK